MCKARTNKDFRGLSATTSPRPPFPPQPPLQPTANLEMARTKASHQVLFIYLEHIPDLDIVDSKPPASLLEVRCRYRRRRRRQWRRRHQMWPNIDIFALSLGKAPRKQLATKAARKTASVRPCHLWRCRQYLTLRCRPPLAVSRSPIASGPEPSPFVKLGVTRRALSSSFASSPSSVSFVRSPRTLRCAPL